MKKEEVEVLYKLNGYFESNSIDYILLGARAISLQLKKERNDFRYTEDIDFSIKIARWDQFHQLKEDLAKMGFETNIRGLEHRFKYKNVLIDIIPFGEKIQKDGFLKLPRSENIINVTGFDKLFQYSETITLEEVTVKTIPLPLIVLTKVLAYLDREQKKGSGRYFVLFKKL